MATEYTDFGMFAWWLWLARLLLATTINIFHVILSVDIFVVCCSLSLFLLFSFSHSPSKMCSIVSGFALYRLAHGPLKIEREHK